MEEAFGPGRGQTIRRPSLPGGVMSSAPGGADLCSQLLLLVPCRPWHSQPTQAWWLWYGKESKGA